MCPNCTQNKSGISKKSGKGKALIAFLVQIRGVLEFFNNMHIPLPRQNGIWDLVGHNDSYPPPPFC
jgi:hypothetical protein